jgi:hypothetical protein
MLPVKLPVEVLVFRGQRIGQERHWTHQTNRRSKQQSECPFTPTIVTLEKTDQHRMEKGTLV